MNVPVVFVMEATGVYYEKLAWYLYKEEAVLSVVLPTKAKRYFQSIGLKSKNDKIDAKGVARMGAEQRLDPWKAPKESTMTYGLSPDIDKIYKSQKLGLIISF